MTPEEEQRLLKALAYREKFYKLQTYFPDKGKHRRALYKKHLIHFAAGKKFRQRLFMCANRVGKTLAAGCELTYHLTGEYPHWWEGKRFTAPQDWFVCGKYASTVKDILQDLLLGPVGEFGTGLIPKHLLDFESMTSAKKTETTLSDIKVKHAPTGGFSRIGFRSYDQGRKAFEGTKRSIWLDEEPPLDVYGECLMRTMTPLDNGEDNIIMMTFTPLEGLSETVIGFLGEDADYKEGIKGTGKWLTMAGWDDVPHLSEEAKKELEGSYKAYQRDARTKGIPQLGSGAVYPIALSKVFIEPIQLPEHFRRCFALDFGFTDPTAILWGAIDPETDVVYVYAEHYHRQEQPSFHAAQIKAHERIAGFVIPGVCDPSGGGTSAKDGILTVRVYRRDYDVKMLPAVNSIEPGITTVMDRMNNGKLKIFNTCVNTQKEYQIYRRDDKGRLLGEDHLMDCLRYLVMSGITIAKSLSQVRAERILQDKHYEPDGIYSHPDYWLYT